MARNGVYRTTGQEPELISSVIEPIWAGGASSFYTGGTLAHSAITNCAMGTWEDRIYLAFPTSETNNRVLVHDPGLEWWGLYDIPASCFATYRTSSAEELVFGYASGSNHIGRHALGLTNDDGAAITSRWRSGWFDLDNPDVKVLRSQKIWGSGKVGMGITEDFETGTGSLASLNMEDPEAADWSGPEWGEFEWAEPKALLPAYRRTANRGTVFSVYFENTIKDQEWAVHRLSHHLREVRKPSTAR